MYYSIVSIMIGTREWLRPHSARRAYNNFVSGTQEAQYREAHSQECIVTPHAAKLIVAHRMVPGHAQGISDFPLLFHREENVTLDAEDQRRCVCQGPQPFRQLR